MAGIRNFEITQPPTSDEVGMLALDAIRNRTLLFLEARSAPTDIGPQAEELSLALKIKATRHPHERGMMLLAETENGETVNVLMSTEPTEPASMTMVSQLSS